MSSPTPRIFNQKFTKIECLRGENESYVSKYVMLKTNLDATGGYIMQRSNVKGFDAEFLKRKGRHIIGDGIEQCYVADLSEVYDLICIERIKS